MNEIVKKLLLAGDKFIPEMYLTQPGFTYSTCGPFTKNKERNAKFKETGATNYIYKNELDKACFQHDMAYGDFQDLAKWTAFNNVLRDKVFNIAKNRKCGGYQRGLASMVYKFFDKKSAGSGANNERPLDLATQILAEELQKPIIRKSKRRTAYSRFKDNIWGVDLAEMQLISKFNKGFRFLIFLDRTKLKIVWIKIRTFLKQGISIILWSFPS